MSAALCDSNILIDYLNRRAEAADELRRYERRCINGVIWIEVMAGCKTAEEETTTRDVLLSCDLLPLDEAVIERAWLIRRDRRLKLPDAVILATAQVHGLVLVTRNSRDFPSDDPAVRVPYLI